MTWFGVSPMLLLIFSTFLQGGGAGGWGAPPFSGTAPDTLDR